ALYCERLVNYFNSHYYDKFQWNVYTQSEYLQHIFESDTADLILVGGEMESGLQSLDEKLRDGRLWAYLVDEDDGQEEGIWYLAKYRRADQIYKDLLDLYARKEHARYENTSIVSGKTTFIAFISAAGGLGASTIACAAAKSFSQMEKTLYLNLENTGSCKMSFRGEEKPGLDELVYAVKSRRNTLGLKIESSVSRDETGTYYFKECSNPMDLQSLLPEEIKELLKAIETAKVYDKVIIDLGNGLQDKEIAVMSMANRVVMVTDNSEIALLKLGRYLEFVQTVEEVKKVDIISKIQIYFNKILKNAQIPDQISQIRVGGAFPMIETGNFTGIIDKIAKMELLQGIK
ncbi:MAG: hypothetical protein K2G19_11285, partial [Lachnospiraceae bacterium]|nr:hypothetical protein [Lachnospiraceae bacterium]